MIHIAICEDIETHANKMKELLTAVLPKNITLTHYTSGKEMLSDIQNSHIIYDLAIMDIELGDASGITLSSRLSEYCPDIQIIFVSQYLKYVSPVYETAHTYFIYKPELELYLKPAVQKALQKIEEHSHLILTLSWNKKKTEILQKDICYMERLLRKTAVYTLHDTFYTAKALLYFSSAFPFLHFMPSELSHQPRTIICFPAGISLPERWKTDSCKPFLHPECPGTVSPDISRLTLPTHIRFRIPKKQHKKSGRNSIKSFFHFFQ